MSSTPGIGDYATVTVTVAVAPAEAFLLFTRDINLWWRRGPRFRSAPGITGIICAEPRLGGRVFESYDIDAAQGGAHCNNQRVIEIGRNKIWDPPNRLVFEWCLVNFAPDERTEVEVLFKPCASGTRVTLIHRGWSHLRRNHPARHGLNGGEFIRMIGLWWGDQMKSLIEQVAPPRSD
jgi:Activator of Hsp90 ATPase homolog 1-like protein